MPVPTVCSRLLFPRLWVKDRVGLQTFSHFNQWIPSVLWRSFIWSLFT